MHWRSQPLTTKIGVGAVAFLLIYLAAHISGRYEVRQSGPIYSKVDRWTGRVWRWSPGSQQWKAIGNESWLERFGKWLTESKPNLSSPQNAPTLLLKGEVSSVDWDTSTFTIKDSYGFLTPISVTQQTHIHLPSGHSGGLLLLRLELERALSQGQLVEVEYMFDQASRRRYAITVSLSNSPKIR